MHDVAVCSTFYPAVTRFLGAWWRSIAAQSSQAFDLWVALDGLEPLAAVADAAIDPTIPRWVMAASGDSPARLRQRLLAAVAERYRAVVLVDADDVLHPDRVQAAVTLLSASDLAGCGLRLIGSDGQPLGAEFTLAATEDELDILPHTNVFGLSNTAYRTDLLRRCLPVPDDVELVDWFLATQAWLLGARMAFDRTAHMDYRQHGANATVTIGPFSAETIAADTARVRRHLRLIRASRRPGWLPDREARLAAVAVDVDAFAAHVLQTPQLLEEYAAQLAHLAPAPRWWSHVAHPRLAWMWR